MFVKKVLAHKFTEAGMLRFIFKTANVRLNEVA